jgi:CheY-like chemotaxis protein
LPGVDGYEVCRRIRRQTWGGQTRVIALTGWGDQEAQRKSQEAGFDVHLVKPVDESALQDALPA